MEQTVFRNESSAGYCEKIVRDFNNLSNKKLCEKASTKNVGYYYRASFPNVQDNVMWCFKFNSQFSNGGLVMVDGKVMKKVQGKNKGKTGSLDFCAKMTKGNHLVEVFGASNVDVSSKW